MSDELRKYWQDGGTVNDINRRNFLEMVGSIGLGMTLFPGMTLAAEPEKTAKKPLVVYFSHSGHTRKIAEDIHKAVGGDIMEIEAVQTYPDNYNALTEFAKEEKNKKLRPAVKKLLENPGEYGVIFLGYPNWWSTMPMPVFTFVEQSKLDGKTIAPFTTHGGGGIADSVDDLKEIVPHSKVLKPLAVNGSIVQKAEKDVLKWLEGLGPALIETTTGNPAIYPDGAY